MLHRYKILIKALGITDSGGITVFCRLLDECIADKSYSFHIFCFKKNIFIKLNDRYSQYKNIRFYFIKNRGLFFRLFIENVYFLYFNSINKIDLIYNFSGTGQFISKTKQLTKIQNLLLYSKKIDEIYFRNKDYLKWIKQIFLKRIVFITMLRKSKRIEIQSAHVKNSLSEFINIKKRRIYIKNDFEIKKDVFKKPVEYNFVDKINFLYIVGPHFDMPHKNLNDFVNAMFELKNSGLNFEITITLSKEQLLKSGLWNDELNLITNFCGYIEDRKEIEKLFRNNTILISTSIIETLGLHVIEGVTNGVLCIVPDEKYASEVYGDIVIKYNLFDHLSLADKIKRVVQCDKEQIYENILLSQYSLNKNEKTKYGKIVDIFNDILN